jgi:hypothetical protein
MVRNEFGTGASLSRLRDKDPEVVKWLNLDKPSALDEVSFRAKWDKHTRDELARLVSP